MTSMAWGDAELMAAAGVKEDEEEEEEEGRESLRV